MKSWAPEFAERAERVPVWTRPLRPSFTSRPDGFAAWGDASADLADVDLAIEPEMPQMDAFAQGFQQGYEAGEAALDAERHALAALAAGLDALRPEPPADLAKLLAATVSRLVIQIVGEVALDEQVIAARTATIAALIAEESAPTRLRLSPDDVARLDRTALPIDLVADAALAPGSMLLETAGGWVEDGPAVRMERLRAALDALAGAGAGTT